MVVKVIPDTPETIAKRSAVKLRNMAQVIEGYVLELDQQRLDGQALEKLAMLGVDISKESINDKRRVFIKQYFNALDDSIKEVKANLKVVGIDVDKK